MRMISVFFKEDRAIPVFGEGKGPWRLGVSSRTFFLLHSAGYASGPSSSLNSTKARGAHVQRLCPRWNNGVPHV